MDFFGFSTKRRRRRKIKRKGKRKKVGYTIKNNRLVNVYKYPGRRGRRYSDGKMLRKNSRVYRTKTAAKASKGRRRKVRRRPKNGRRRKTYRTARKWSTKGEGLSASDLRKLDPSERQGHDVRAGRQQMSCSIHQPPCPKGCERGGGNTCRATKGRGGLGVLPKSGGGHLAGWGRMPFRRSSLSFGSPWNYGF